MVDDHETLVKTISPRLEEISAARRFVVSAMDQLGAGPSANGDRSIEVLASEAISNAVIHAGTEVKICVSRRGKSFRVEVHDESSDPVVRRSSDIAAPGGRGLRLIDALADSWGVTQIHDDGKVVWFEVDDPASRTGAGDGSL